MSCNSLLLDHVILDYVTQDSIHVICRFKELVLLCFCAAELFQTLFWEPLVNASRLAMAVNRDPNHCWNQGQWCWAKGPKRWGRTCRRCGTTTKRVKHATSTCFECFRAEAGAWFCTAEGHDVEVAWVTPPSQTAGPSMTPTWAPPVQGSSSASGTQSQTPALPVLALTLPGPPLPVGFTPPPPAGPVPPSPPPPAGPPPPTQEPQRPQDQADILAAIQRLEDAMADMQLQVKAQAQQRAQDQADVRADIHRLEDKMADMQLQMRGIQDTVSQVLVAVATIADRVNAWG